MKARSIGYWTTTALVAAAFAMGGVFDLSQSEQALQGLTHLGYPAYFAVILGAWKLAAAVALLVPRFPLLKEWAYAGLVFDLTGAAASHAAVGDSIDKVLTPLVFLALTVASWALRPQGRTLRPLGTTSASAARPAEWTSPKQPEGSGFRTLVRQHV